jgi:uncharacterized protein with HEPN domain
MKRDETVYLRHILDAIGRIELYLQEVDESTFSEQSLIQDGVIRQLEIIGEAVKGVSVRLRSQQPSIPWQDIAGMRDKLIHDYFGVDLEKVWLTATEDLPALKIGVAELLESIPDRTDGE